MPTPLHVLECLNYITDAYQHFTADEARAKVYAYALEGYDRDTLMAATRRACASCKFPPTVAEIREAIGNQPPREHPALPEPEQLADTSEVVELCRRVVASWDAKVSPAELRPRWDQEPGWIQDADGRWWNHALRERLGIGYPRGVIIPHSNRPNP